MPAYRISQAARVLGVSDDTVRRWADSGRLAATRDESGRRSIDGADLADLAASLLGSGGDPAAAPPPPCNRFTGIVTGVVRDRVVAQVEMVAGPFRVVSLLSREVADRLGLERGVVAVASARTTDMSVEPFPD